MGRYSDPNGNVTEFTLDQQGQMKSSQDGNGRIRTVNRNSENLVAESSDGRGFVTNLTYDPLGNPLTVAEAIRVRRGGGASTSLPYDSPGDPVLRPNAGFNTQNLPANDDESTGLVGLGFDVNYFGQIYSRLYVNNNGNVTFDAALSTYTPFDLLSTTQVLIAPFFGDVDTRGIGSVTFGTDRVAGRDAFGVNWTNVGHFDTRTSKTNSLQLVLVDRSDVNPGDFDFEFNYQRIEWETGDDSGGVDGLGGSSARAGYSNGVDRAFEIDGSAVNGAFLDNNPITGLIHGSRNSIIPGRYRFEVRNGLVTGAATTTYTYDNAFSQVTSIEDPEGRTTTFSLDPATGNRLASRGVVGEIDTPANGQRDDLVTAYTESGHDNRWDADRGN
jgi:YD repeat-containing protein